LRRALKRLPRNPARISRNLIPAPQPNRDFRPSWDCLEDSPNLSTIRQFLHLVPDGKLLDGLRRWRGHGRNDCPVHVLWGTLLLTILSRLKIFWGADDGNIRGSRRFHAFVGAVMVVHIGLATLLASAPRWEGTLGKTRLGPIQKALRQLQVA